MGRLILFAVIVLAVCAVVATLARRIGGLAAATGSQLDRATPNGALMQKTSFVLLVSLILYVALWGGA